MRRRRPWLAAAQQAPDGAHELVGQLLRRSLSIAFDDAVMGVIIKESEGDLVERRLDGRDLGDDVDAVAVLVDHPLDAANLAFDSPQPGLKLILRRGVAAL